MRIQANTSPGIAEFGGLTVEFGGFLAVHKDFVRAEIEVFGFVEEAFGFGFCGFLGGAFAAALLFLCVHGAET